MFRSQASSLIQRLNMLENFDLKASGHYSESAKTLHVIAEVDKLIYAARYQYLADKPYVKINWGALSEPILESEIFGYEKGSFTGAESRRKRWFEIADGGKVYPDEINSMLQSLQVRLLRILRKQSFFRVGGVTPVRVNLRVIASTNRDIEKEMEEGHFRKDLYYRLCVVRINLPPLRERKDDISPLIEYSLKKYCPIRKMIIPGESMNILCSYHTTCPAI